MFPDLRSRAIPFREGVARLIISNNLMLFRDPAV